MRVITNGRSYVPCRHGARQDMSSINIDVLFKQSRKIAAAQSVFTQFLCFDVVGQF